MRNRLFILFLLCLLGVALCAEQRVVLRSNKTIVGTIIFQNEEVVIIRDADGKRFQYLMSEVVRIEEITSKKTEEPKENLSQKKVGIMLQVTGGALVDSHQPTEWGGYTRGQLLIGANNLLGKHIFLGGGVGYEALFLNNHQYHLLPIELYSIVPCMQTKHAPFFGLGIGYGVALKGNYTGGFLADIDFGWRMQISEQTTMLLGVNAHLQQLTDKWVENLPEVNEVITNTATHTLCGLAAKVAFIF